MLQKKIKLLKLWNHEIVLLLLFPISFRIQFNIFNANFKQNIDKLESLQKKAINLLMGLPRISPTAEAFWAWNILPFRKLGIFNVIKFLFHFKETNYPQHIKGFQTIKKISKTQILDTEKIFIFLE